MFNFGKLKASIADIKAQAQTLCDDIKKKRQARDALNTLPLPQADFIDAACEDIDRRADKWTEQLQQSTKHLRASYSETVTLPVLETNGGYHKDAFVFPTNLYGIFREPIKQAIRKEIASWDWPKEVGPSRAKRQAEIQKLDREIASLEKQAADLQAQASAAGISIQGIDPAPTKREQASALTERVARLVETTPFPNHTIRQMLIDGKDPLKEALKVPTPNPDGLDSVRSLQ